MIKNLVPFIIVIAIIFLGGAGAYFIMNQKVNTDNLNTTSNNSFVPVTGTNQQPSPTITPIPTIVNTQTFPDGLKIEDEKIGQGAEVKSGDTISINYIGTLENGQKFDSSYDRGQPFVTQIGVGQVIKGWDEGVLGMKVGGKRRLTIPSDLGYGSQGAGQIPPNSTLIFEVELMGIK